VFLDADLATNPPPKPSQHTVRAVTHHPPLLHLLAALEEVPALGADVAEGDGLGS